MHLAVRSMSRERERERGTLLAPNEYTLYLVAGKK